MLYLNIWLRNPRTCYSRTCAVSTVVRLRFEDTLRDMSARLSSIESYLATMHGDIARHGGEIETINARLDRIERRLELHDSGD